MISLSLRCGVNTFEAPQCVTFICSKSPLKGCLKNRNRIRTSSELLKKIEHLIFNKRNFADLRHIWEPYLKLNVLRLTSIYARHSMEMKRMSRYGIKDCLTEASLGWKCFDTYNKSREFYTFNDKYVHDFIRKSIKCGRVAALNGYFESNQCEKFLNTIKKLLELIDNEISKIVDEYLK